MQFLKKSLLAGSVLLAASVSQAANISIGISYDPSAEADYKALLKSGYVQENFDNLDPQGSGSAYYSGGSHLENQQRSWENSSPSFSTDVGTFSLIQGGHKSVNGLDSNDGANLKIESAYNRNTKTGTGEFGREALSTYEGDFWLDSNDAREVTWDFNSGAVAGRVFDSFGFYIADPADVAAQLTLKFSDGSYSDAYVIPFQQSNSNVGYVTVKSDANIVGGTLTFDNSANNDGWGIDDVTVGRLPEPGTLLLMGLGLLGLGAARRRAVK